MRQTIPAYIGSRLDLDNLGSSLPLLRLLDAKGPMSQRSAARALSLTTGTCNLHVQRLAHEGLIRRAQQQSRGRGRPAMLWDVDRSRNYCVTLVLDAPFFQASLTDLGGHVLEQHREDLTGIARQADLRSRITRIVAGMVAYAEAQGGTIRQAFAAFPGLVDPVSGAVRHAVNFPLLNELNVTQLLRSAFDLPCFCASLGLAFYYGEVEHIAPSTDLLVLYWDLGIGAVFGRGERIISLGADPGTSRPQLAEIGHIRIRRDGEVCHCKNHGCLEAYTGGWAMIRDLERRDIRSLPDLLAAVEEGDRQVTTAARRAARLLGQHLAWPLQLVGVDRIVVSGPLAPVFRQVRGAFLSGLAARFTDEEIAGLDPQASRDPAARMHRGAFLLAKRVLLHPELFAQLPQTPQTLR